MPLSTSHANLATPYPLDRTALVSAVADAVRDRPDVLAAWEGGSAAWGRADRWSDADVQLLAADDEPATIAAIFDAVERTLSTTGGGIVRHHEVPEPAWHGHAQRFYHVAFAGPFVMLDLVVLRPGVRERFLAPEQHGHARVLFDHGAPATPHTAPPPFDPNTHRARMKRAFDDAVARFDLFQPLVAKDIARGRPIDAIAFFHALTLRPLVTLLGLRHRPLRFDFGNRYLHADLPPADAARLADLFCVRDLADLAAKHPAACTWFHDLARAIDVDAIDLDAASSAVRRRSLGQD